MVVPIGRKYQVTVEGSVLKSVDCENCDSNYWYEHKASATSQAHTSLLFLDNDGAREGAENEANEQLQEILAEHSAVPCPNCGWYQSNMVDAARESRLVWLAVVGWMGIVFSVLVAMYALYPVFTWIGERIAGKIQPSAGDYALHAIVALSIVVGFTFSVIQLRRLMIKKYEPNSEDADKRIALGQELALSSEQAKRMTAK